LGVLGWYFCLVITPEIFLLVHGEYVKFEELRLRSGETWEIEKGDELVGFVFLAVGGRMGR